MKKTLVFLIFLFITLNAYGQSFSLSGKVTDKNTGEPLAGAHIIIYPSHKITFTNFDGEYEIANVEGNGVKVKVTMLGYKEQEVEITSDKKQIDFEMLPFVCSFDEIVITGTRTLKTLANTPVLTKVVNSKQIMESGAVSALDALEFSFPGIGFTRNPHGGASLLAHGLGGRYNLILLDGQRMTGETLDEVNIARIDADDIEKIEVIGGAASALYGSNAISSVINIITKKNKKKWGGSFGNRYSPKNKDMNSSLSLGYNKGGLNVRFNGFRRSSSGYKLDPKDEYYTQPAYVDYSGRLSGAYDLSKNLKIKLEGRYFQSDTESGIPIAEEHKLRQNYTYSLGLEMRPFAKHLIELKASSDDSKQTSTNMRNLPDEVFAKNSFKTLSFIDTYTHNEKLQIVLGSDYNYESVFSNKTFGEKTKNKDITDFNAYAQVDYKILPTLNLVSGLRFTHNELFGSHYTPKFTLMKTLGDFKLRGNISWGYKAPALKNLYYNFFMGGMFWIYGNPNLKPEKSFYNSLSAEYSKRNFNASINLFSNKLEDKIESYFALDSKTGKRAMYYGNRSAAHIKGIETYVNVRLWESLSSQLGYTYLDSDDLETGPGVGGISNHSGTFGITWNMNKVKYPFSLNVAGRMHSGRIFLQRADNGTVESEKGRSAYIFKTTFSQDFNLYKGIGLQLQLGVDNVLDYKKKADEKDNISPDEINPGRIFWAAVRLYL